MKPPVVVVGIGEMGSVFARALLRAGHPVYPVTRELPADEVARELVAPSLVLVCVAEADLHPVLETLPARWRERVGLLQNELLPRDWQAHGIDDPTVAVVWFEKKRGTPIKPILPTVVAGPRASLLVSALSGIGVPAEEIPPGEPLLFALVAKNLYILTANIAGLVAGGTVGALWRDHRALATEVFDEVLRIEQHLAGTELPRDALLAEMLRAFEADPDHAATGRSAPARLARALGHAKEAGLPVPRLEAIAARS